MPSTSFDDLKFSSSPYPYTTIVDGCVVNLQGDYLGVVNGGGVTDYDCHFCGPDWGRHVGRFCRHQEALLAAMEELQALEGAQEIREMQMVAVGRDDRREAYYDAGVYPPHPLY